ncbi:MAG: PilZ domain-containing protein [Sporomusaceae bacterium]|nr:PilZ domain-containing protein [Sporomusaceae bacterium]
MSSEKIFKVNQRLQIIETKGNQVHQHTSRIEEFIHGHMIIAMPMQKGSPVFQERGKAVYGKVFDESGVYAFKCTFVDKKMSPLPIWIVTMPVDIKKSQQRSFVRFDIALPVVIEYPLHNDEDEVVSLKLITKDLSGGGLQLICNRHFKNGSKIKLTLDFSDYGVFQVDSEVVRIHQPQAERQLFWVSVKFLNIPENVRDKISRFIFRKQLEQRQKGL